MAQPAALTGVVIGAGQRGRTYADYALDVPNRLRIVGVAEPNTTLREAFCARHQIPPENAFTTWEDLIQRPRLSDVAIVTTQDHLHKAPVEACARLGYHILVEKPMATTKEDCLAMVAACSDAGVLLAVCHVLRHLPVNQYLKHLIETGAIGQLQCIQHIEPVGAQHFAHSYVRGNWRQESTSSFSLLTKCCHDVDLVGWWAGSHCSRVSSFGGLHHFRPDQKPEGAASRCMDCPAEVENSCPYSAKKIYIEPAMRGWKGWPLSVLTDVVDIEDITEAVRNGPYGRCVYACDNDVVDNQVVNLQFASGVTASLSMVACTVQQCVRQTRVFGSLGELSVLDGLKLTHYDFATGTRREIEPPIEGVPDKVKDAGGHAAADWLTIDAFVGAVIAGDAEALRSTVQECLVSYSLTFDAEDSRKTGSVVERPQPISE